MQLFTANFLLNVQSPFQLKVADSYFVFFLNKGFCYFCFSVNFVKLSGQFFLKHLIMAVSGDNHKILREVTYG